MHCVQQHNILTNKNNDNNDSSGVNSRFFVSFVTINSIPRMKLRHILLVITLVCFTVSLTAQTRRRSTTAPGTTAPKLEDLPKRPLDTIPTSDPETKIILFSNNTWSYYRPSLERLDALPVYTQHWDTTGVFAYRDIAYNDLPPVVELKLVDDLTQFKSPVTGKVLSKYGPRRRRNHNGVDIPLRPGEPVYATFDGRVRYAKYNTGGYGNLVIVRHRNGLETWNAHLSKLNVKPNDYVKAGQVIGFSGNTGRSRGPHLHYEMRYQDQTFDPEFIVDFETGQLKYQTFALEKSFFNIHSRASEILEEEDEYDLPLLTSNDSGDSTSQDILDQIAEAQQKEKKAAVQQKPAGISSSGAIYHTIKSGDMLGKLAIRYGVTIDQICRLNGITRNTVLRLGKKLRIK